MQCSAVQTAEKGKKKKRSGESRGWKQVEAVAAVYFDLCGYWWGENWYQLFFHYVFLPAGYFEQNCKNGGQEKVLLKRAMFQVEI